HTHAAAMSTERLRHRRDDADLAHAIVEGVAPRRLAAGVRDLYQRPEGADAIQNFRERDHDLRRPHTVFLQRHELDEAHHHAFGAGELAELDDLIVVEAAQQHAVHFHRVKTRPARGTDARQHSL